MAAEPFGGQVGQIILQAAKGIIAQKQAQRQLQLRAEQLKSQNTQQDRNFDLRQEELDIRQRTVAVQEDQLKRTLALQPLKTAQAVATLEGTRATTAATQAKALRASDPNARQPGDITENQLSSIGEDIQKRGLRIDTHNAADNYEEAAGTGRILPRFSAPEQFRDEATRLSGLLERERKSAQAALAAGIRQGTKQKEVINRTQRRFDAIREFMASDEYISLLKQIGATDESTEAVTDAIYPQFKEDLKFAPVPSLTFDFGTVPQNEVDTAWDLFRQGNVDLMMEKVLDSTGGSFTDEDRRGFQASLERRFPTPGQERDQAISNWYRMYQRITAQRAQEPSPSK